MRRAGARQIRAWGCAKSHKGRTLHARESLVLVGIAGRLREEITALDRLDRGVVVGQRFEFPWESRAGLGDHRIQPGFAVRTAGRGIAGGPLVEQMLEQEQQDLVGRRARLPDEFAEAEDFLHCATRGAFVGHRGEPQRGEGQRVIPRSGKGRRVRPRAQPIGRTRGNPRIGTRERDRSGFGKRGEELPLALRRPPGAAHGERNGFVIGERGVVFGGDLRLVVFEHGHAP